MPPVSETALVSSNRPRAWLLIAAAFAAGMVVYFLLPEGLTREFAYCVFGIGSSVAIGYRVVRGRPDERRGWLLLFAGVAAWTAGDTVWAIARLADPTKDSVELADVLYIVGYVPIGLSILAFADRRPSAVAMLDTLILTTGAAVLMWAFVVAPELTTDLDIAGVLVATGYALGDLVLIAVAVRLLQRDGPWPSQLPMLVGGLIGILASDLLFLPIADTYHTGMLIDIGWIAAYGLWASAAVAPDDLGIQARLRANLAQRASWLVRLGPALVPGRADSPWLGVPVPLLLVAAILGPISIAVTFGRGSERDAIVLGCLSIVLVTLVVGRLGTTIHQLRSAITALRQEADAREAAETGLRTERSRFDLLLDQLPVVVVTTDRDLRITSLSGRNLAAPAEDTIGLLLPTFMEAMDPSWSTTGAEARALAGESVRIEGPWMDHVYQVALEPYRDQAGEIQGIILISIDVTESRHLELQLERARKMEALGLLAGGVAHDFNNVLTAIRGYGELVRDALPLDDSRRVDAEEVVKASERAAQLTNQLLAYSRGQVLRPEIVDPKETLARVVPLLRRIIGEDIDVIVETDPAVSRICADPGRLDQIILNLAVNARDAMPDGGTLRISATNIDVQDVWPGAWDGFDAKPGPFVRLRVSDNGVGMTPETRAHIFEPFFTTKRHGHGTGLGLATVYGVVRQSGGFVRVDSTQGVGSTFDVCLPVVDAPIAEAMGPDAGDPGRGSGATVVVVEDESTIARLESAILERAGYRTIVFASADEALEPVTRALGSRGHVDPLRSDAAGHEDAARGVHGPDMRASDPRPSDPRPSDPRPSDPRPSDPRASAGGESDARARTALAIAALANDPSIACVVTDVLMPGMKGPDLAARLRSVRPELPVAFISGYAGLDALPAIDAHTAFLPKPFTAADLLGVVERLLGTEAQHLTPGEERPSAVRDAALLEAGVVSPVPAWQAPERPLPGDA